MSVVIRFLFLFSIVTLTLPLSGCVVTLTKLAVAPVKSRIEERKLPKEKPQSFEFTLDELKKRLAAKPDVDAFIGDKHKVIEENKHDLIKHLTFIPKWLRKLAMQKHYM